MKRLILVSVVVIIISVGLVLAQQPGTPQAKPVPAAPKAAPKPAAEMLSRAVGVVKSIDVAAMKLVIEVGKEVKEFVLAAETKIMKGGKKIDLSGIAAGDKVAIRHKGADVKSVTVYVPKAKAVKPAQPVTPAQPVK